MSDQDQEFPHRTADLAERAGVTANTIAKWKGRGFFVGITVSKTGGGSGVFLRWPPEAMVRIDEISELRERGLNTEMIVEHFKKKTGAAAAPE